MPAYLVTLPTTARATLPEGVTDIVLFASNSADAIATCKSVYSGDSDAAWAAATATEIVAGSNLSGSEWGLRVAVLDSDPVVDVTANGGVDGVVSAAINAGGTGYSAGDVLTVAGGTATRAATIRVTSVNTGVIDGIEVIDPGEYSADPSTTANAVTGGGGSSATLDLTMGSDTYATFFAEVVGLLNATSPIAGAALDMGEAGVGSTDLLLTIASGSGGDDLGDKAVEVEFLRNGVPIAGMLSTITDEGSSTAVLSVALTAAASLVLPNVVGQLKS